MQVTIERRVTEVRLCEVRERYIRWLVATRDLSPNTIRAYHGDVVAFERHLGEGATVAQIDHHRIFTFVEGQRAAGLAPKSIRRRASGVRGFCRWLQASGLLEADPWAGATVVVARSRHLPRVVASHDLGRLLRSLRATADICGDHVPNGVLVQPNEATTLLAVSLMVVSGLRVGEVVGLGCRDMDIQGRGLRVLGKGRRERRVFLTNDWIVSLTAAYLTTRSSLGITHDALLFNHLRQPMTAAALRSRITKAANVAGLYKRVTPHMLRHTAATELIEAGVDIRFVQRLLGHASLATTELYTHVSDRALQRVVTDADVLGRALDRR